LAAIEKRNEITKCKVTLPKIIPQASKQAAAVTLNLHLFNYLFVHVFQFYYHYTATYIVMY